jgi:hypothetical protein
MPAGGISRRPSSANQKVVTNGKAQTPFDTRVYPDFCMLQAELHG